MAMLKLMVWGPHFMDHWFGRWQVRMGLLEGFHRWHLGERGPVCWSARRASIQPTFNSLSSNSSGFPCPSIFLQPRFREGAPVALKLQMGLPPSSVLVISMWYQIALKPSHSVPPIKLQALSVFLLQREINPFFKPKARNHSQLYPTIPLLPLAPYSFPHCGRRNLKPGTGLRFQESPKSPSSTNLSPSIICLQWDCGLGWILCLLYPVLCCYSGFKDKLFL